MTKQWNWGNHSIIEKPKYDTQKYDTQKKGCYACIHYCSEDKSCLKTEILPYIDGNNQWKKCEFYSTALPESDSTKRTYKPFQPRYSNEKNQGNRAKTIESIHKSKARMIPLTSIMISAGLKKKLPSYTMINRCKGYYKEHGRFESYVSVKKEEDKYVLIDINGYAMLVAAMELGLKGIAVTETIKKK